ncbi:hypothetical protein T484DRAFT_1841581 [Baffinella frigidus]|nr:hypothetical protein T484DRAFT_1841581 [Cryptophyta sp. CCMP2293]
MTVFFASGLGPLVNAILFDTTISDTWTLPELRIVMLVGLSPNLLPVLRTSFLEPHTATFRLVVLNECALRGETQLLELRIVMLVGLSLNIIPVLLTSFLRSGPPQVLP